jgi:hypothetical protein
MFKFFKYFSKEKRQQRRKLKELSNLSSVFSTISKLETTGLLIWSQKDRRLFIAQSLASLMLAKGAEAWTSFVQNIYLYHYFNQCSDAWQQYIQKEELAAVRKASEGSNPPLTRTDADRIRLAARQRIMLGDVEPPQVQLFEFFIIRETEQAKPDLIAVGYFDPATSAQEIAPWSEVAPLLQATPDRKE